METSDNQLIRQVLAGDNSAFAVLIERYKVQIYNLMYRYSGSREEAADLTQDVFCKLFEKLDRYREQKSFFSWLYVLALNHARDWSRKRTRHKYKDEEIFHEPESLVPSPGDKFEARQETQQLLVALDTLSEDRREMVILRYRHEHSIREIATIFSISESAVKMRLHRSLAELGRKLHG